MNKISEEINNEELMKQKIFHPNNRVIVSGEIIEKPHFSHQILWERFYESKIAVKRLSGILDILPIMISEALLVKEQNTRFVKLYGQFRSYNYNGPDGKRHLKLYILVNMIEDANEELVDDNEILLTGFLCKKPNYRETSRTKRAIVDLMMVVNRDYGKSDYIPIIGFGRFAHWASYLEVGTKIKLWGRIQSREHSYREYPYKGVAYEVLAIDVNVLVEE